MKRWFYWLIPCLWAIAGCAALGGYTDILRDKGLSAEYRTQLDRWTRSQVVHSQFETRVHLHATFRSAAFNRAYLREHARVYRLTEEELQKRLALQEAQAAEFSEFVVYAYLPDKSANDFDRRGTVWSIYLTREDGVRIQPLEVRRIEPVTRLEGDFFPYINPHYGSAYRLRFPPDLRTGKVKLVFTGVVATVELDFDNP